MKSENCKDMTFDELIASGDFDEAAFEQDCIDHARTNGNEKLASALEQTQNIDYDAVARHMGRMMCRTSDLAYESTAFREKRDKKEYELYVRTGN